MLELCSPTKLVAGGRRSLFTMGLVAGRMRSLFTMGLVADRMRSLFTMGLVADKMNNASALENLVACSIKTLCPETEIQIILKRPSLWNLVASNLKTQFPREIGYWQHKNSLPSTTCCRKHKKPFHRDLGCMRHQTRELGCKLHKNSIPS